MKQMIMHGVPSAIRQDSWWLEPFQTAPLARPARTAPWWAAPGALMALIALGDVLVWQVTPGVSLALFGALVGCAALLLAGLRGRALALCALGLALSLLPLVELVQPLSVLICLVSLSLLCAFAAGLRRPHLWRGALRLWWVGPWAALRASAHSAEALGDVRLHRVPMRAFLAGWAVPLGLGSVFALLLIGANPVLDAWLVSLADVELPRPNGWRLAFWAVLALLLWPCLHLTTLTERLRGADRRPGRSSRLLNAASVTRSLLLFNALFAVQTGLDIILLGAGAGLPEGMSYAHYAHRGAYPLLVTALLAGGFALAATPFADKPLVRAMLLIWLTQTLALVAASVVRLELYVDTYGLTRLRLAAFIWMALVTAGLAITFVQIATGRPARWMILRSAALGAATLYACCFVSFDAAIARHNLAADHTRGHHYVCTLSEDALPALEHWQTTQRRALCDYVEPRLSTPQDWREWGFRNARTRHSLARMEHRP
ncbi:MAG: DUF4173 domain-containing protein [Pseudomonadota bacterium]